jgi:transcriptional regulator with PAS, ATPase and Fis domain
VLQERRIHRVGGDKEIDIDVRLVAATNADLGKMQQEGSFRSDLYYRLNVFPIEIPPLRERPEDIAGLVDRLVRRCNGLFPKDVEGVTEEVLRAFRVYSWPGNVRELENVLERAHVLATARVISGDVVPPEIMAASGGAVEWDAESPRTLAEVRRSVVETAEQRYLTELLAKHRGRIDTSAAEAGITPRQLHKLLTRHSIRKEWFKPARLERGPAGSVRKRAKLSDGVRMT